MVLHTEGMQEASSARGTSSLGLRVSQVARRAWSLGSGSFNGHWQVIIGQDEP